MLKARKNFNFDFWRKATLHAFRFAMFSHFYENEATNLLIILHTGVNPGTQIRNPNPFPVY
jgi:hypothetical protein